MRVVHAVCTDAFAGVERHVAQLAAAESDRGHEVLVAGGRADVMQAAIGRSAVRHLTVASVGEVALALSRRPDADVFNVHMTAAEIAAGLAFPSYRVPVVATRHFAAARGQSSWLAGVVARRAARRIAAQIAVSRYVADHIEGASEVVVSGVPSRPDGPWSPERQPFVLVAQRLEPEKRTEDALRIFAASRLAQAGWRLAIAGEGRERHRLERIARQIGVRDAVRFLGHRPDIDALMRSASLLLAPRADEALGLTVLEAMSHALPVVAAGAGGHLETVGSVLPELCYPPGDHYAAAELLTALATDPCRRDLLGRYLQNAQRTEFTVATQAAATEAVYRSIQ